MMPVHLLLRLLSSNFDMPRIGHNDVVANVVRLVKDWLVLSHE